MSISMQCIILPYISIVLTTNKFRMGGIEMKKYEYKCVFIGGGAEKTSRILTEYGKQGWELVCIWWAWHYLKREVEN